MQEFLAAKHVTETFTPEKIIEFITSHIQCDEWQLVLQFVAGLLGNKMKEMKMFENNCYQKCVLAFTKTLALRHGKLDVNKSLFEMRCLSEVGDENIVKDVCATSILNQVVRLEYKAQILFPTSSDWAAMTFVCKHLENLVSLYFETFHSTKECQVGSMKLVQQRCIQDLTLVVIEFPSYYLTAEHVFSSLINSKCILDHEHINLTNLALQKYEITDKCFSMLYKFFGAGHAINVQNLKLAQSRINSQGISMLCNILSDKFCQKLRVLNLWVNDIDDEGIRSLCDAIIKCRKFLLAKLDLGTCCLTDECIPALCELTTEQGYNLTILKLGGNTGINDKGLKMLCEHALLKEHCKLQTLDLHMCSITDKCIPKLAKSLQNENCALIELILYGNKFTKRGMKLLVEIAAHEVCRARGLVIKA